MCLMASFMLPRCEKDILEQSEYSHLQMDAYYVESKGLMAVSLDSVTQFKNKVDGYVDTYPLAKQHEKYPLIQNNIKTALLSMTITINDEWDGDTTIYF